MAAPPSRTITAMYPHILHPERRSDAAVAMHTPHGMIQGSLSQVQVGSLSQVQLPSEYSYCLCAMDMPSVHRARDAGREEAATRPTSPRTPPRHVRDDAEGSVVPVRSPVQVARKRQRLRDGAPPRDHLPSVDATTLLLCSAAGAVADVVAGGAGSAGAATGLAAAVQSVLRQRVGSVSTPPHEHGGFANIGNTCYMNAVLSCLACLTVFHEALASVGDVVGAAAGACECAEPSSAAPLAQDDDDVGVRGQWLLARRCTISATRVVVTRPSTAPHCRSARRGRYRGGRLGRQPGWCWWRWRRPSTGRAAGGVSQPVRCHQRRDDDPLGGCGPSRCEGRRRQVCRHVFRQRAARRSRVLQQLHCAGPCSAVALLPPVERFGV
jgi:hypothetical protein